MWSSFTSINVCEKGCNCILILIIDLRITGINFPVNTLKKVYSLKKLYCVFGQTGKYGIDSMTCLLYAHPTLTPCILT